jgi:hypothetical protein
MTRCIVIMNHADSFINIEADSIIEKDMFLLAMQGGKVAGVFDKGCVCAMYLTEKTGGKQNG